MLQTPIGLLPPALATKVLAYCEAFCSAEDERYLWFAAHAALPVALTPDLAYKIWLNFRKDEQEKPESLGIPWIAVSDLLLSPLYRPTGRDIYEMHPDLRAAQLQYLKAHPHFGPRRLDLLARFLKFYLRENRSRIPTQAFLEAQEFVCNAHLEPRRAAEQLLALWNRQADKTRFRQLLSWSEQEVQLEGPTAHDRAEANPLGVAVQLVKGVQQFQAGNKEEAVQLLRGLKGIASRERQEGIAVEMPQGVLKVLPAEFFGETPVVEEESGTAVATRYAKIHLLTPGEEDQAAIANTLFGEVSTTRPGGAPFLCYQWETPGLFDDFQWKYQVWQLSDQIPEALDHFLFTSNGIYAVWISEKVQNVPEYLNSWLQRLKNQLGPQNIWLFLPKGSDKDAFKPYHDRIQFILEVGTSGIDWFSTENQAFFKGIEGVELPTLESEDHFIEEAMNEFLDSNPGFTQTSDYSHFGRLNEAGLIRQFNVPSLDRLAFKAPGAWVERLFNILRAAMENSGVFSGGKAFFLKMMDEYPLLGYYISEDSLFIPSAFPQTLPDFYIDHRICHTSYFVLKFDFLPTDFRNRLTYRLLSSGSAALLANRLPIVLGIDGFVAQIEYYPERKALHLLFTKPGKELPAFLVNNEKDELYKIFQGNWKSLKEALAVKSGDLIQSLTKVLDAVKSTYPYPISFTSKTLQIPAHATPALDMVFVKGGTFTMGDVMRDKEFDSELPLHEVTLDSFRMGRFAVTFDEYDAFCEATGREKPNDQGWGRGRRPVINVSWYDAVEYCNWLSEIWDLEPAYTIDKNKQDLVTFNPKARGYRLPTEAQWEYAARQGGKKVRFGNGKDVADPKETNFHASKKYKKSYSIVGEYRGKTVPVGSLNSPNELGLHDMSGNVREWCWDWFGNYSSGAQTDPTGPLRGSFRVSRGGSWSDYPRGCRVAYRYRWDPENRFSGLGFRLVLPPVSSG